MSSSSNQQGEAVERTREVKRRRRSVEEKRQIAEASLQPGASVAEVAQAYGVHPSQVGKMAPVVPERTARQRVGTTVIGGARGRCCRGR